jgi:hypothetical protein
MSFYKVDRDESYMMSMWGTNRLITDYGAIPPLSHENTTAKASATLDKKHLRQEKIHQKIRNDVDYDDWEYGTEPIFGKSL